jgi:hypothetical protein
MGEADWASPEQTMIGLLMRYQVGKKAIARCSSLRLRMLVVLIPRSTAGRKRSDNLHLFGNNFPAQTRRKRHRIMAFAHRVNSTLPLL